MTLPNKWMVCISCSESPGFTFAIVAAALAWRRLGFRVAVGLVADAHTMSIGAAGATLRHLGAEVVFRRTAAARPGLTPQEYGKLLRWDLARELPQDRVMTVLSDADMLRFEPLSPLPEHLWTDLLSWGSNLYDGTPHAPRWPVCYLGGQPEAWLELGPFDDVDLAAGRAGGENMLSDEVAFKSLIVRRPRSIIPIARDVAAMRRVGREDWDNIETLVGMIDAHVPRDAWRPARWPRFRQLFSTVFDVVDMDILETHRETIVDTARD